MHKEEFVKWISTSGWKKESENKYTYTFNVIFRTPNSKLEISRNEFEFTYIVDLEEDNKTVTYKINRSLNNIAENHFDTDGTDSHCHGGSLPETVTYYRFKRLFIKWKNKLSEPFGMFWIG